MSLNRVFLIGNVGQDPDVKSLDADRKVASISVATTKRYTDRSGDRKEQTEWYRVVVYGKTADFVEKYVKKGSQVFVEGELRTRSYTDKSGTDRQITEVIAEQVQNIGGISQERQDEPAARPSRKPASRPAPSPVEDLPVDTDGLPF